MCDEKDPPKGIKAADELRAGVAKIEITDKKALPFSDPLFVKALVLKRASTTAVLVTLDAAGRKPMEVEVAGLRVGEFVLVTFPGELTVVDGLTVKKSSPHKTTFVAGYTNGYSYYTPTEQLRNSGEVQGKAVAVIAVSEKLRVRFVKSQQWRRSWPEAFTSREEADVRHP